MGLAIAGMHYTAMAAAHFTHAAMPVVNGEMLLGTTGLAVPVVMGAFVILTLTIGGSITDRWVRAKLAAAEALRESEERYRSVVSEIDEVIFRTDANGRWIFLNPAWTQITGFTPEESLGTSLFDYVHPDDRAASDERCRSIVDGTTDFCRHEVRYVTKDKGSRWVEVHARATRDSNGALSGTAGVIRDVTERREAEEALRRAREVAEAASRAKSEFLSRMSHELRTPLNAILGFGQLMELEATSAIQRENADHVLKAGRHLLSLINEVLDITGIEAGRLRLSAEPVRVADAVREVFDLIGPLATARSIELGIEPTVGERYVQADRQRLKQILLNLIANAVKYNREGGRAIVGCVDGPADSLRIVVADTGAGIHADKIGRLFTPFDRLGAEQQGVEGTGLGLALSKRLAEAMKGTIGVESQVGTGSEFWLELPKAEGQLERLHRLELESGAIDAAPATRRRVSKILYVEDNLSNLTLIQRVLARRRDVELIPCMQGGLALELARIHRPALVLLDLHLPDMSGEMVLSQLRQAGDCRDIPVIVLSADATQNQINRLLSSGVHAYITKPLDVKPFIETVDEILDARAAA
ncbi:MAG TPA: PAS domain S-box protein, partial [Gemmatimonadaceae bacterium]